MQTPTCVVPTTHGTDPARAVAQKGRTCEAVSGCFAQLVWRSQAECLLFWPNHGHAPPAPTGTAGCAGTPPCAAESKHQAAAVAICLHSAAVVGAHRAPCPRHTRSHGCVCQARLLAVWFKNKRRRRALAQGGPKRPGEEHTLCQNALCSCDVDTRARLCVCVCVCYYSAGPWHAPSPPFHPSRSRGSNSRTELPRTTIIPIDSFVAKSTASSRTMFRNWSNPRRVPVTLRLPFSFTVRRKAREGGKRERQQCRRACANTRSAVMPSRKRHAPFIFLSMYLVGVPQGNRAAGRVASGRQ